MTNNDPLKEAVIAALNQHKLPEDRRLTLDFTYEAFHILEDINWSSEIDKDSIKISLEKAIACLKSAVISLQ